ncbi:Embryonic polyadenylate-binding protein 2 [Candida viswanathii]|uniref:Embryonic polyadenylate-binding protein 2 n=1 Tax=Candida viswanathii TaxID=5486 RepID=A0A367YID3_9ASCO|nr:Embryonic polyadenylate-binding protein 2 [Candida viswanathii]
MSDQVPIEHQLVPDQIQVDAEAANQGKDFSHEMEQAEQQAAKLRQELHSESSTNGLSFPTDEQKRDSDSKSIYIGNVDYGATPLELQQHFSSAGVVNRVTIITDKTTGQAKGFAYLEFVEPGAVERAVETLDGSTFRERQLKVNAKRTNIPGINVRGRGGHRGGRGGRGGFRGGRGGRGGRGRGGFRGGRGGARFNPY